MNRLKKVIAACIDRIFEFDSQEEAAAYMEKLRSLKKTFRIVQRGEAGDKYRVRIQEQYNSSPMLEN